MFIAGEKTHNEYPYVLGTGLWVVHVDSEQYRAWRFWLSRAFNKKFFPEPTMQVWYEFPPITQEGADRVAQAVSEARDGFYTPKDGRTDKRPVGGSPVPRHPLPWNGAIPPKPKDDHAICRDAMAAIRQRLTARSKRNNEEWAGEE